jgi:hypothetical protein
MSDIFSPFVFSNIMAVTFIFSPRDIAAYYAMISLKLFAFIGLVKSRIYRENL